MKIRSGFVSNSSLSSFMCDISGEIESGYNASASNLGMTSFACGHTVLDKYADKAKEHFIAQDKDSLAKQLRAAYDDDVSSFFLTNIEEHGMSTEESFWETSSEFCLYDELPAAMCPICNLTYVTKDAVLAYLLKSYERTMDDVVHEIKSSFGKRPDVFWEYVKDVKTNVNIQ
jgi:hypothetical protein